MTRNRKRWLGSHIIKMGQYSVGKSHYCGMYDPKIPETLWDEMKKAERQSKK